jgi:hypothetical protein
LSSDRTIDVHLLPPCTLPCGADTCLPIGTNLRTVGFEREKAISVIFMLKWNETAFQTQPFGQEKRSVFSGKTAEDAETHSATNNHTREYDFEPLLACMNTH